MANSGSLDVESRAAGNLEFDAPRAIRTDSYLFNSKNLTINPIKFGKFRGINNKEEKGGNLIESNRIICGNIQNSIVNSVA